MLVDINLVRSVYKKIDANVDNTRKRLGHPLTLAEKILYSHLYENEETIFERAKSYVNFKVDRVAMQDATAQMALLQLWMQGKRKLLCQVLFIATI